MAVAIHVTHYCRAWPVKTNGLLTRWSYLLTSLKNRRTTLATHRVKVLTFTVYAWKVPSGILRLVSYKQVIDFVKAKFKTSAFFLKL